MVVPWSPAGDSERSSPRSASISGRRCLIGYFYVNAYTGNHGITARQGLDVQMARLATERDTLRAERQQWERRVALLKSQSLDPDMLDERARALLDYVDARDLTLMVRRP